MLGLKLQMALATSGAILLSIILFGVSYLLTPNIDTLPMPKPSISNQITMALFWIALSALLALAIVGIGTLISRRRKKEDPEAFTALEEVDDPSNDQQKSTATTD